MGHSEIYRILLFIVNLQLVMSCGSQEYSYQDLCCPLCSAGTRVFKHCTAVTSTSCIPCARGAFTEHPNSLEKCFKCKHCDPEMGFHTLHECTETQDTVCDCREGYICLAKSKNGCRLCTKYVPHTFNGSTNNKGDPKHHEARPTIQSRIINNVGIKFLGPDDARNSSMLGNKTAKKKSVSKSEISTMFKKEEPAPETTTGKPKLVRGQDPLTVTKVLMTLMQGVDPMFPKESLRLQEMGNMAILELQNTTKTSLAGLQNVMQTGLANIRVAIQSGMAAVQSAMKTGMSDIQSALQSGMTGIQQTLKAETPDIRGIKNGLTQVENTLKQLQTNSQSNWAQMNKQVGALVNVLTKLTSNQSISLIQLKDLTCKFSNKTELKAESKAEGKTEGKADGKSEGKAESKIEDKAESKAEGKTNVKMEAMHLQVTQKQP